MQPCLGLAASVRLEQLVGVGRGLEGDPGQGEVAPQTVPLTLSKPFRNPFETLSGSRRASGSGLRRRGVAPELPRRPVAFDGGIGVGVETGGGACGLGVVDDLEGARRRCVGGREDRAAHCRPARRASTGTNGRLRPWVPGERRASAASCRAPLPVVGEDGRAVSANQGDSAGHASRRGGGCLRRCIVERGFARGGEGGNWLGHRQATRGMLVVRALLCAKHPPPVQRWTKICHLMPVPDAADKSDTGSV